MDEKLAIESFIELRKQWNFYMQTGNVIKASETFQKMVNLGNKFPGIARMINTSRLGPAMLEAGFTGSETGTAVSVIETATVGETVGGAVTTGEIAATTTVTAETGAVGMTLGVAAMSVGAVIAIAVILGVAAFAIHQFHKRNEHEAFAKFARGKVGNPNIKLRPFLGRVH